MTANDHSRRAANRAAVLILVIVIAAIFVRMIWSLLLAVVIAAILAGLTSPLYKRVLRMVGGRKAIASAVTLVIVILVVVLPLLVLIDIVTSQAVEVGREITPQVDQVLERMSEPGGPFDRVPLWDKIEPYREQITLKLGEAAEAVGGFLVSSLSAAAQGAVHFFFGLFIMLYSLFFFLMNGRDTLDAAIRLIPLRPSDSQLLLDKFVTVSRATMKGTLVIGIVQGGLAGAAFAVVGIGGAVFWGTVMAVLSVLPGIGTALVWVPAVAYLLAVGRFGAAAGLFLWCAIVVGSADNVLRPRLVGKDTEMPDLLVMLSTFGGLALFGAVGLVLGPVIAALFLAVAHIYADTFSDVLAPSPEPVGDGRE
jgi:predicted PurR-regulated permease PerM